MAISTIKAVLVPVKARHFEQGDAKNVLVRTVLSNRWGYHDGYFVYGPSLNAHGWHLERWGEATNCRVHVALTRRRVSGMGDEGVQVFGDDVQNVRD